MTTDRELLEVIQKDLNEIKVVLKGYGKQEGLCEKVDSQGKNIIRLWLVLTAIAASSGGSFFALFRVLLEK